MKGPKGTASPVLVAGGMESQGKGVPQGIPKELNPVVPLAPIVRIPEPDPKH